MNDRNFQTAVMELSPWTHEKSFSGNKVWWDYVMSKSEHQRLESLIGMALLDETVCARLVKNHDDSLLSAFGLSRETVEWLKVVKAGTLLELAEAISIAYDAPAELAA
jgi:hypothetical protein